MSSFTSNYYKAIQEISNMYKNIKFASLSTNRRLLETLDLINRHLFFIDSKINCISRIDNKYNIKNDCYDISLTLYLSLYLKCSFN